LKDNESSKKYISINTDFFFSLRNTSERNAYYVYVSLLLKFNNNYIKNATPELIQSMTGISRNSWFKYQKILLKYGLIKKANGKKDLMVEKQAKEHKKHYTVFHLFRSLKAKHIEEILMLDLINRTNQKQHYTILLKDSVQDKPRINISIKQRIKFIKALKRKKLDREVNYQVFTSFRGLEERSCFSLAKVYNIVKKLKAKHIIKTNNALSLIKENSSFDELLVIGKTHKQNTGRFLNMYFNKIDKKLYEVIGTKITCKNIDNYIVQNHKQLKLIELFN